MTEHFPGHKQPKVKRSKRTDGCAICRHWAAIIFWLPQPRKLCNTRSLFIRRLVSRITQKLHSDLADNLTKG